MFLDESGAKTNITRLRGRAPRGKRLHTAAPCGRWQSTTMISSIRLVGTAACMHLPGAADMAAFVTYLTELLCPTLSRGDIVVMDNLAVHESPQVAALVEAVGAEVRFLPAYSPDLNPIEKMWSKIKASLRSTEHGGTQRFCKRSGQTNGLKPSDRKIGGRKIQPPLFPPPFSPFSPPRMADHQWPEKTSVVLFLRIQLTLEPFVQVAFISRLF